MKITIERSTLMKSLAHVQSVVERRTTIPILGNVKLSASDGRLALNATDMDLDIVDAVECDVMIDGETTAPAHMLYEIVRKLPDGAQVELDNGANEDLMVLRAGRSKFTLACLPTTDFPEMASGDLAHDFDIAVGELKGIIDRTRFAISTEETRYYLNGIYIHAGENNGMPIIRAVATDGHRLASVETPLPDGATDMPGVIVPRKTVNELRKLIDEATTTIRVSLSDTKIRFAFNDVILTSKLIDGTFPDYERVIPTNNDKMMELDCKTFAAAVDRVSAISTEKSRAIKLTINPSALTLSASSTDAGSATEELEVSYGADTIDIGFNSKYLLDIAQQIEGETAQFMLSDGGSPTIVRDSSDSSALYVLMPMRV